MTAFKLGLPSVQKFVKLGEHVAFVFWAVHSNKEAHVASKEVGQQKQLKCEMRHLLVLGTGLIGTHNNDPETT